jgi:sulfite exporter TauE/SafE
MAGFGLSTAPALIGISLSKSILIRKISQWLRKALPFWLLIMAILFLLRGANLGIPFLSPKFNQNPIEGAAPKCCH